MSWKSVNTYILAKEYKPKEKTLDSGIVIPETVKTQKGAIYEAVIVDENIDFLKPGQLFLVAPRTAESANTIPLDDEEFIQFNEKNVILVKD